MAALAWWLAEGWAASQSAAFRLVALCGSEFP